MPRPFAQHYDAIYADKNYDRDIQVFEELAHAPWLADKRVLEIGAGTGNHTLRLSTKVGHLVSVETDADFAKVLSHKLSRGAPQNIAFFEGPVENLFEMGFDAAVAFFHVLNYINKEQSASFLNGLAYRLKPGACFIADLWNGAAALIDPPREEIREKEFGDKHVIQRIRPSLDVARRTVTLNYQIDIERGGLTEQSFSEQIALYLWERDELAIALTRAGFSNIMFWDYRQFPAPATPESWRLWLRAIRD